VTHQSRTKTAPVSDLHDPPPGSLSHHQCGVVPDLHARVALRPRSAHIVQWESLIRWVTHDHQMKNCPTDFSELAQTLRLVDADEREIERLEAYERRSRATLALVTVLVAVWFGGRVDERRVAALAALLLVAAGLLPYLAVRLRRRALERRRDRVLNSSSNEG